MGEKSPSVCPKDWSEVTCAMYPAKTHPSDPVARAAQHNTESIATPSTYMVENSQCIPREAVRSSSVTLLFMEMLHFMSESMNLKEIVLKVHPCRHVRQTGI